LGGVIEITNQTFLKKIKCHSYSFNHILYIVQFLVGRVCLITQCIFELGTLKDSASVHENNFFAAPLEIGVKNDYYDYSGQLPLVKIARVAATTVQRDRQSSRGHPRVSPRQFPDWKEKQSSSSSSVWHTARKKAHSDMAHDEGGPQRILPYVYTWSINKEKRCTHRDWRPRDSTDEKVLAVTNVRLGSCAVILILGHAVNLKLCIARNDCSWHQTLASVVQKPLK